MPIYEYRCDGCGSDFQVVMTIEEHVQGGIECPQCRETEVSRRYPAFYARKSRKSGRSSPGTRYITHPHENLRLGIYGFTAN